MTEATQAAIALAEEHGLDLTSIEGTGLNGKVTKGDVEAALEAGEGEYMKPAPLSVADLVRQCLSEGLTTAETADKLNLSYAMIVHYARNPK